MNEALKFSWFLIYLAAGTIVAFLAFRNDEQFGLRPVSNCGAVVLMFIFSGIFVWPSILLAAFLGTRRGAYGR